jgi:hypothetical protein
MLGFLSTYIPPSARPGHGAAPHVDAHSPNLQKPSKPGGIAKFPNFQAAFAKTDTMSPARVAMREQHVADGGMTREEVDQARSIDVETKEADSLDSAHGDNEEADREQSQEGQVNLVPEDDQDGSTGELALYAAPDAERHDPVPPQKSQGDAPDNVAISTNRRIFGDDAVAQNTSRSISASPDNSRADSGEASYQTMYMQTGQRDPGGATGLPSRKNSEVTQGCANFDGLSSQAPVKGSILGGSSVMGPDGNAPGGGQTGKSDASSAALPISPSGGAEPRMTQPAGSVPVSGNHWQSTQNLAAAIPDNARRTLDSRNGDQLPKLAHQNAIAGPAATVGTTTLVSVLASPASTEGRQRDTPQTDRYNFPDHANMRAAAVPATDMTRHILSGPGDQASAMFAPDSLDDEESGRTAALLNDRAILGEPRPAPITTPELRLAAMLGGGGASQMARHVAIQLSNAAAKGADRPIDLTLNPAELGRVRITLTPGDGGMVVSVSAERPETLDLMRRHIDVLDQEFRDLGYGGTGFSFSKDEGQARRFETDQTNDTHSKDELLDNGGGHNAQQNVPIVTSDRLDIRL